MLHSGKLEGWSHVSPLILDIELQDLEFAFLVFGLALAQYFLTTPPFLPFGTVMYILLHCMLEV